MARRGLAAGQARRAQDALQRAEAGEALQQVDAHERGERSYHGLTHHLSANDASTKTPAGGEQRRAQFRHRIVGDQEEEDALLARPHARSLTPARAPGAVHAGERGRNARALRAGAHLHRRVPPSLHQTPRVWKNDLRRAVVRVNTSRTLRALEIDGGIWMDATPADNRWTAGS